MFASVSATHLGSNLYRSVFGLQLPSPGGNSSLTGHHYLLDHIQIP
jgi:hypothetical protein